MVGIMTPVHPHRRGEHGKVFRNPTFEDGSSPQAWGTLALEWQDRGATRFIPTGVGNTEMAPEYGVAMTVHPHRRGEHMSGNRECRP